MKRNSLTTAVVAGIAGVAGFAGLANAVDLNPDGLGQVLIYPYYTVNKGQATLLSVVNTADVGKAVKVRFLEGYNSREVLDFNLFLSPHDVWVANVTEVTAGDATSGGQINTQDHSCVDVLPTLPYPFSTAGFDGGAPGQGADDGPQTIDRTREGYVEIISMGDIIPGSDLDAATTHAQNGTPDGGVPDCGAPIGNTTATSADLVPPTGGLFGAGTVINVSQGTFFGYNADAVDGFSETVLFTDPSSLQPTLQSANTPSIVASGFARSYVFTNGGSLLTVDYAAGEDAVSAVFMADAIYNEYFNDPNFGAGTDWIITFPTKRFYVDKVLYPAGNTDPFEVPFDGGSSDVLANISVYDREEGSAVIAQCPSPPSPTCFASNPILPYEVNALSFVDSSGATASAVFGSALFKEVKGYGHDGWAQLDMTANGHALSTGVSPTAAAITIPGLPVTGFQAYNVINTQAQAGVLANYGGIFRHRAHRSCAGADPACS